MMRLMLAMTAIAAALSPAWGQRVVPRERSMHMATQAGQELHVFTYTSWHRDCSPEPPPQITLRMQPAHGSILLRPSPSTVSVIREGSPDCTGRTYPGIGVWYVPAPGFRGADQFDYNVVSLNSSSHDTVIVDVRQARNGRRVSTASVP